MQLEPLADGKQEIMSLFSELLFGSSDVSKFSCLWESGSSTNEVQGTSRQPVRANLAAKAILEGA